MRRLASACLLLLLFALLAATPPAAAAATSPASGLAGLPGLRLQLASWFALWWPAGAPAQASASRPAPPSLLPIDCGSTIDPNGQCHPAPHLLCRGTIDRHGRCRLLPPTDCGSLINPDGTCNH